MIRVIIESPLGTRPDGRGRCTPEEIVENQKFALECIRDSFRRNEFPLAPHALYPLVLDDATPEERKLSMRAGFAWAEAAALCAVYVQRGITDGMRAGITLAKHREQRIVYRVVDDDQNYLNEELTLKGMPSDMNGQR